MPELDPTDQGIDKTCEPEEQRPQCQGSNREQRVDTRIPEDIDADCRERLSPIPDTPTSPVPLFTQIAEESTTVARSQPFEEPRCDTWWLPRHYGHPLVPLRVRFTPPTLGDARDRLDLRETTPRSPRRSIRTG